jgi:pyruvate dehydrogenase E2 component (dihydrolipoamide acetyltransferase)
MTINVVMPKLGMSMREGTIIAWHVAVGERIHKGQYIAEVESEKTVCSIEALDEGMLVQLLLEPGETCAVGEPIAVIEPDEIPGDVASSLSIEARSHDRATSEQKSERLPEAVTTQAHDSISTSIPNPDRATGELHGDTFVPLTSMRRAIASRLQRSAQAIPQVTLLSKADARDSSGPKGTPRRCR